MKKSYSFYFFATVASLGCKKKNGKITKDPG